MTKTTTTYAIPPETDGPVWDRYGARWDISPVHGLWCEPGGLRGTWIDLLRYHGPLTNTEPVPDWPTADLLWHDGEVWIRQADDLYESASDIWEERHMTSSLSSDIRDDARRFAREAVPVVPVPAEEWRAFRASVARRECHYTEAALIAATDVLGMGE